jgi:hypothetical protein
MYALNDHGDLHEIGDAYSLNENMENVSGVPLMDPYSLSDRFGF